MDKSFDLGALLNNHAKKHKNKPAHIVSVAGGVQKRLEKSIKNRKSSRLTVFDSLRSLSRSESPVPVPLTEAQKKLEHRKQQLEKWKEEKEKKKKEIAAQKKKPFVAGVPHNQLKFVPPPPPKPSTSGRVTRSQSSKTNITSKTTKNNHVNQKFSQSFAPKNAGFKAPQLNFPKLPMFSKPKKDKINITFEPLISKQKSNAKTAKVTTKQSEIKTTKNLDIRVTRGRAKKLAMSSSSSSSDVDSLPMSEDTVVQNEITSKTRSSKTIFESESSSENEKSPFHGFPVDGTPLRSPRVIKSLTPKTGIPKSESSSEEKLRSPKSPGTTDMPMTPEQIAAEAKRMSPCVTMSRGKDNARKEMKKKLDEGLLDEDSSNMESVEHFRRQLESESTRIAHMCDSWDKISEQTVLPEAVMEQVLGATGQARLLLAHKLVQFAALVSASAAPDPARPLVTPADLHGFWDMVFMQVENVDMRFKKLEELRARNWVEEQPQVKPKKVVKPQAKKSSKPTEGPSRLRDMIAAARKAKKEQQVNSPAPVTLVLPPAGEKTFDAGFFSVRSPVRSPVVGTPNNKFNLLKSVLSSEAKKASAKKASYAILRASLLCKNVEFEGFALQQTPVQLTPININATPARSILKSAKVATVKKSSKKSIKTVLFDESDSEHLNESVLLDMSTLKHDEKQEQNADSGLSSMDLEKDLETNKENSRRKSKLIRQEAVDDRSPVLTRSRRKSLNTPKKDVVGTPRTMSRKKKGLLEVDGNVVSEIQTPKRSLRNRKSAVESVVT